MRLSKNPLPRKDRRSKWSRVQRFKKRPSSLQQSMPGATGVSPEILDFVANSTTVKVEALYKLIKEGTKVENVDWQEKLITSCLERILFEQSPHMPIRTPHLAQVRSLRRLIYNKGDTLLIAKTGFGKSLILHSFSILTQKTTLQIIPLNKLGNEQYEDIHKIPGARPCVLTSQSQLEDPTLISKFKNGEFSHVLLGPEQAASDVFRTALKDSVVQSRLGLVAIDECHLVRQWEAFRPKFTMLGELRSLLRQDIVWFGCSATLDEKTETTVLNNAGFRQVGDNLYETEVIRTSINRPDVSISVVPIPRGQLTSWDPLYFLLDQAWENKFPVPTHIPKTIIFLDSHAEVSALCGYLQNALISKFPGPPEILQYSTSQLVKESCVYSVIQTFSSRVAQYDQDKRYSEFLKPDSVTRIIVATTSLGIGVNIPDVERVVLWKFPQDNSAAEYWQRIGRGGRGSGKTSKAYIFLPYWVFDSEGEDPVTLQPSNLTPSSTPTTPIPKRTRASRNQLPSHRRPSSRLSESFIPHDISDTESIASCGAESVASSVSNSSQKINQRTRKRIWTQSDRRKRQNLDPIWHKIANGLCKREPFLKFLGEYKIPSASQDICASTETCCNGCNPLLTPVLTLVPYCKVEVARPNFKKAHEKIVF